MSTDTSDKPGTSTRVRSGGGVRRERQEERGEEENVENEGADSLRDHSSGSQGVTGDQAVQRELNLLQRKLILQRELNLQRELTIQRDIVRACAVILTLLFAIFAVRTVDKVMDCNSANDKPTMGQTNCDNLTLERDQLKSEVYQLQRDTADLLCSVKSCSSGWQKFGCSCYYRSTEEKSWEESREHCLKTGAHLVVISSEEEQVFVRELDKANSRWDGASWIGLNKTKGGWTWVDGTPATGYWVTVPFNERPDSEGVNCAEYLHQKGAWSNLLCSYKKAWICEKSLKKVQLSALLCEVKQ